MHIFVFINLLDYPPFICLQIMDTVLLTITNTLISCVIGFSIAVLYVYANIVFCIVTICFTVILR